MVAAVAWARRGLDHPRFLQLGRGVAVLLGPLQHVGDAGRRVAYEVVGLHLVAEVPLLQVLARDLALLGAQQAAVVELGELRHEGVEPCAATGGGVLVRLDLHSALLRELAHRLHEGEALHLLHELDRVAAFAAAEAVVEAP